MASFFSFLLGERKTSAAVAKERLRVVLAHERAGRAPGYLPLLQRDLVEVICKYVKVDPKDVKLNLDRQRTLDVLEVKVELPPAR